MGTINEDITAAVKNPNFIRVSALPSHTQASADKLDVNRDGALGPEDVGVAIQNMEDNKRTNRNLKKIIAVFVFLTVLLIGCIFAASITAASLLKDIRVASDNGFAYVKGSNEVMKTSEALITTQGTAVGLFSDDELLRLSQLVLKDGGLKFKVNGFSRGDETYNIETSDTVMLQVEGGTITYDNIGIIDATGSALDLLEHSFGPFGAADIDGRRRFSCSEQNVEACEAPPVSVSLPCTREYQLVQCENAESGVSDFSNKCLAKSDNRYRYDPDCCVCGMDDCVCVDSDKLRVY